MLHVGRVVIHRLAWLPVRTLRGGLHLFIDVIALRLHPWPEIEASVKQLVNKAASGDLRALHHLTALARFAEERSPEAITPTSVMAEVDQKVLRGIFSRFEQDGAGGRDDEPDEK
jgi:hypothetical protein